MKTHYLQTIILFFILFFCINKAHAIVDIGVTTIISPETGYLTSTELVIIEIYNFGDEAVSDFNVGFNVDGLPVFSETFSGTLEAGATAFYTFSIGIDLSALGVHTICAWTEITDDDPSNDSTCEDVISLKIVDIGDAVDTACTSLLLDAENIGTTYLWSTGDTTATILVTESGTYYVQVTEPFSGFVDTDTIDVTIDSSAIASFSYSADFDGNVTFTNTSLFADTYLWDFDDGTTSTEINPLHTYEWGTPALVLLSAENHCSLDTIEILLVEWPHSIFDLQNTEHITLSPNPTSDFLNLDQVLQNKIFTIFNIYGEIILEGKTETMTHVSELENGFYIFYCDGMCGTFIKQ